MRMTGQEEFTALEQYIRSRSSKVKRSGNGIVFNCFYHNDNLPSASMKIGRNGMPMCYCSVCGSIYHQLKKDAGLWQDKADSGGFTPFEKFLYYNTEDEYKMYDFVTEKYLCSHFRMKDKEKQGFPRGIRGGEHVTKGTDGIDTTYAVFCNGHLKEVKNAIEKKILVAYAEGEKDIKCLWNNGYISFTCGGTNTFKKDLLPYLKGGRFVVFGDNDSAGIADAKRITALLNTVGTATMIIPPEVPEKGDISDYMKNHTKEDLQTLIENALNKNTVKETVREGVAKHDTPIKAQGQQDNPKLNIGQGKELDKMQFHLMNDKGVAVGVFDAAIENYIIENQKLFIYGGIPFIYRNGCFFPDWTKAELSTSIREKIYDRLIKSTTIDRVFRLFLTDRRIQKTFEEINTYPAEWICFENGMYDPVNKRMIQHDDKYCCINQIPHEYHPEKPLKAGKTIEEYLNFICDGKQDTREMLLQFLGYSLTRDTKQQKFLILTGEGGSGKSTLIKCFEMLVGQRNISNVSLTDLQQRFSSIELMGMLANSCADLEIGALTDTSMIKKLVGEDSIKGERKGKDLVFFKNYAKLIFSTNELPVIKSEKTNAFYRRLIVFPMNKVPERKDPDLFHKLEAEKDYLLMLAVQALERMYEQKNITVASASEHEIERLRADSDTVEGFILEECEKEDGCRWERTELYKDYSDFCEENERQALTKNNFYKSLRLKGYSEITSNGKRYFLGLKSALENCTNDGFMTVTQEQLEDLPFV